MKVINSNNNKSILVTCYMMLSTFLLQCLHVQAGTHYFQCIYWGDFAGECTDVDEVTDHSGWTCNGAAGQTDTYKQAVTLGSMFCEDYKVWSVSGLFGSKDYKYSCCDSGDRHLSMELADDVAEAKNDVVPASNNNNNNLRGGGGNNGDSNNNNIDEE